MNSSINHSTNEISLRAPAKVFVLGEYLALASGQALVLTFPPHFELTETGTTFSKSPFHPDSPAGKFFAELSQHGTLPSFHFEDPFKGSGGFGGSTAEFSLLYRWMCTKNGKQTNAWDAWEKYQSYFSNSTLRPSGADLISQMNSKQSEGLIAVDIPAREIMSVSLPDHVQWTVFSATEHPERKTRTHEHLNEIAQMGFPDSSFSLIKDLSQLFSKALNELKNKNVELFAKTIREYAETLSNAGFEDPQAKDDRLAFQKLPQVLAVKGCGALLSDAVLVLSTDGQGKIIELGKNRGLTPIWP